MPEGGTPARSRAPCAARAPSSMAETSLNAPTYSAIAVRAPARITTSSGIASNLLKPCVGELRLYHPRLTGPAAGLYAARVKRAALLRRPSFLVALALVGACNTQYDNPFANTSPTFAPSADHQITYPSNGYAARPGSPREVFAVSASGANLTRLTFCNNDTRKCDAVEAAPAPDRHRTAERRVDADNDKDGQ